jgi:hypothetical protein
MGFHPPFRKEPKRLSRIGILLKSENLDFHESMSCWAAKRWRGHAGGTE